MSVVHGDAISIFSLEVTRHTIFTARCYAERANATVNCLSVDLSVCLSVCLSVTFRYRDQKLE